MPRRYLAARYHYPRFYNVCLDPENCVHTTDVPDESCECCGQVIPDPEPATPAEREHVDVCHSNRGGICNCAAGVPPRTAREATPK